MYKEKLTFNTARKTARLSNLTSIGKIAAMDNVRFVTDNEHYLFTHFKMRLANLELSSFHFIIFYPSHFI